MSSRRRTEVTGLASHSDYWFRVRAMGAAGVGPMSNVAMGKAR
ncbi:MAG: fibronectin type III domain-containing protein [Flavobacteriales bacterium]|nr:fibronectin type III domain-containing protein [Flavobacteriales bacterium]